MQIGTMGRVDTTQRLEWRSAVPDGLDHEGAVS